MRTCLLLRPTIYAHAAPPRDNTSRIEKSMNECKDRWSTAYTGSQLLYAAQVALSTLTERKRKN